MVETSSVGFIKESAELHEAEVGVFPELADPAAETPWRNLVETQRHSV